MSRTDCADLEILRNPDSKNFLAEIAASHLFVTHDQILDYFRIVLSHFSNPQLDVACGKEILRALCKVLSISDFFLKAFVDNGFAEVLPIKGDRVYLDDVLDVLFVLVKRAPRVFNETIAEAISTKIRRKGEKYLMLLAFYSQQFNEVDDPWPMLDLLFQEFERFMKEDIAGKYAMLLSTLVQTYPEFRRGRGEAAWKNVCELLSINNEDVLIDVYNACCCIASVVKRCRFPFVHIKEHIMNPRLLPSVISLLLVVNLEYEELRDKVLIKRVIEVAKEKPQGTLVLMRLAQDRAIAQFLVESCSWMEQDMPDLVDTLRIFLVVFQHKPLRTMIAQTPEFIVLMKRLIEQKNQDLYDIVSKILRRIELDQDTISDFSDAALLEDYIAAAKEMGTMSCLRSMLLVLSTISEAGFVIELQKSCSILAKIIKADNELFNEATTVAAVLCKHEKCRNKLREIGMFEYFKKLYKQKETKRIAGHFLNAISID